MTPLPPGSRIGILGDGQLCRMLALAAARLGMAVHVYGPDRDGPAHQVAASSTVAEYDDQAALADFAASVDVATYEFENVPAETAATVAAGTMLYPSERALEVAQDRLTEKRFIAGLGIAVAPYQPVDSAEDLSTLMAQGFGAGVLKTRRLGYDGKGQVRLKGNETPQQCAAAFGAIGQVPAILEGFVAFSREVSVVAAHALDGSFAPFDPAENVHRDGILAESRVPASLDPGAADTARTIARTIADALDYVGVIGVEMFVVEADGNTRLLVNEIAPRVHNSGHWTMDACASDQFEQHIRAICGWPLGDPARHSDVVMTNLIGADVERWRIHAGEAGTALHLYGKRDTRPGRKMGHVNRIAAPGRQSGA